ncbi:MAG TPA: hypothetical protein VJ453_11975, partial [Terriglobales bacterium]|nr:hypothetical protein [Terriglobales bacterium]
MTLRCNGRKLERFSSTVLLIALMLLGRSSVAASDRSFLVYVGTYTGEKSKGIYAYRFNATTGSTTPI